MRALGDLNEVGDRDALVQRLVTMTLVALALSLVVVGVTIYL